MKKTLDKVKQNRSVIDIIAIFVVALMIAMPVFHNKVDVYFDDGSQHLMRAYHTYQTILQKENTNVISSFTNGFGYSWNLFYGSLSSDFILVLGSIFTFQLGFKIAILLLLFLAGMTMYKLVFEITDNRNTSCLASFIYMTSPYFFTDLYIRHAMGEAMAFLFIPLVFLGLYHLFNTEKNHYDLVFGAVGLILSHNISTVLTALFAMIYSIINIKNIRSTRVKKGLCIDIIFIVLITSFFWVPFLETKFFTDYRVYEPEAMSTQEGFLNHALELKDLFIAKENGVFVFEIGLPVILMLAFSWMTFRKLEENRKEYLFFLLAGILSIWMTTRYFPWKWLPNCFYIIQLPWRLSVFSSFFLAIVGSINMATLIRKFNGKDVFILAMICVLYLGTKYHFIPYSEEVKKVEDISIHPVTGQNNEWLPGMGRLEYLPNKAYCNSFYIATRESNILVLTGEALIQEETKQGNNMTCKITTQDSKVELELPFIYYPGYTVNLDGMKIGTFETENGFLGCEIEKREEGTLEIKYTGTNLMSISKIISILAGILFAIDVWKKH